MRKLVTVTSIQSTAACVNVALQLQWKVCRGHCQNSNCPTLRLSINFGFI